MKTIRCILNIPWTIVGLATAVLSVPTKVKIQSGAIIFNVKSFWWLKLFTYGRTPRACANGNVILLGRKLDPNDLKHELVHVRQQMQYPFIYPFLYYYELFKKGYRNNRFEDEAYREAGNHYGKLA